ncbi:MAG: MTH938/NDUFAF3 family protein [Alphaproteobacteria bacterium]
MDMKEVKAKPDQLVLTGYGPGQFRLGVDMVYSGSLLLLPDGPQSWPVRDINALTVEDFAPVLAQKSEIDILLFGVGKANQPMPRDVRLSLEAADLYCEVMDTGAACRTFNVLVEEQRRVFAALIAV